MHAKTLIAGSMLAVGLSAAQKEAPVTTNNPVGPVYVATLPETDSTTIRGSVSASAGTDGQGVVFAISFSGLAADGAPYSYHVHQKPVPADGDCQGTGGHLDPFKRGDEPPCDAEKPATCEVGDLSGKHGKIEKESFSGSYTDLYASTNPDSDAFIGDRSIVVHNADGDRVTCGSFKLESGTPTNPPGTPGPTGTGIMLRPSNEPSPSDKPKETPPPYDGAGTRSHVFSVGAVLAAVIAFAW